MEIIRRTLKVYVISTTVFIGLTFVLAAIINFTGFREEWTFAALVFILSGVCFITGIMEGSIIGKKGLLTGAGAAVFFVFIIFMAAGGIFADSFSPDSLNAFYLIPVLAGSAGGVIGANSGK